MSDATSRAPEPPEELIEEIREGRCVAFVGAGFAAGVVPGWRALLLRLAEDTRVDEDTRVRVQGLLPEKPSARAFETAAQMLADAMGRTAQEDDALRTALRAELGSIAADANTTRLEHLSAIPFQGVVTTNFDGLLEGDVPTTKAYAALLRTPPKPWWHPSHWNDFNPQRTPVLKLHGDVGKGEVVFTQQDYRRRLFGNSAYMTFLRSLMATKTILYLGVSFTDAYLNQLRSEILSLVEREERVPLSYALMSDVSQDEADHMLRHEGIRVLSYSTAEGGHQGFDDFLADLAGKAGHDALLRSAIAGRHILWVDPAPGNNRQGIDRLKGGVASLTLVDDAAGAADHLTKHPVDLVISHWGHGAGGSKGEEVLRKVRESPHPAPVIIFASGHHADDNRMTALAAGATDYVWTWPALYREIERVLTPASVRRP